MMRPASCLCANSELARKVRGRRFEAPLEEPQGEGTEWEAAEEVEGKRAAGFCALLG